ncbi:MAG: DNA primase [Candidatus Peregrinibacteria bacterium]
MADVVSDIKARLDIYDVVSQYVQLKKTGRNYKGLCPFHSEKTPSFVVSAEKQICHCFGCNKGGDIFTFIQEVEGVEFPEALTILADRAGVKVEKISKSLGKADKGEKDEYFKAHDLACEFFEEQLHKTNDGKKVLDYIYKRGLKDVTIKDFRIGFAPDGYDILYPYLLKKGISRKVLWNSGFISSKNIASEKVYDKFRGRLMFPIFDYLGRVCGFGGRALKEGQAPKYLNSPENSIYSKSKVLYGLYHSKKYVKEEGKIVLVEGYFDVILPYQEGAKNLAAVSGTALTEEQIRLIKRITENVVTSFDLDDAGFEATKRSYSMLAKAGMLVKTIGGFEGKDPAEAVLSGGADKFKEFIDGAKDFVSFYIDKLVTDNDVSALEGRTVVIKELLPLFKVMSSSVKDFYVRELAGKMNIASGFLYDEIENFRLPADHPAKKEESSVVSAGPDPASIIFGLVMEFPGLFRKLADLVSDWDLEPEWGEVYKELSSQYNAVRTGKEKWDFDKGFLASNKGKIDILMLYAEEKYGQFSEEAMEVEIGKLVDRLKKNMKNERLNRLHREIKEAEDLEDMGRVMSLLKEQRELQSR